MPLDKPDATQRLEATANQAVNAANAAASDIGPAAKGVWEKVKGDDYMVAKGIAGGALGILIGWLSMKKWGGY